MGLARTDAAHVAGGCGWYTAGIYVPDGTRIASVAQEQLFASRRVR